MNYLPHLILAVALLALFGLAAGEVHDYDIFWQLQSGKYMLETGSFIYKDIFSLASEVPRFEHCWLHDIIFYGSYVFGGYAGVSLLKAVLITATVGVIVSTARQRQAGWLSIAVLVPTPVLMTFWAWKERPQLWTYLLFAVFLLILERYRRQGGNKVWWLLPLTALWANLHAGVIIVVPILLAYMVGEGGERWIGRSTAKLKPLLLVAILSPLALLITPYATETLKTLWHAPQFGESSGSYMQLANIDWKATTLAGYPGYFKAMGVAALLLALNWRSVAMRDLLLFGGLAFMGLKLERHTPFFFFAMAALLPAYLDPLLRRLMNVLASQSFSGPSRFAHPLLLAVAIVLSVNVAKPAWRNYGFFQPGLRTWHFPVQEAEFVREQRIPGNIYNTYGIGGYLMWTLFPDYLVFWDSRQDSAEMFALGMQVKSGDSGWDEILTRFQINTLILEACSQADGSRFPVVDRLASHPKWALVWAGESHLVFARRAAVTPEWLKRFELPVEQINATVLSASHKMLQESPLRPQALWELARVHLARREFEPAFNALKRYREVTRPQARAAQADTIYNSLAQRFGHK